MPQKFKPFLAKLPSDPAKRMNLLAKFLTAWGAAPKKPANISSQLREAKKRLGGMPVCLNAYYKQGIDSWLRACSTKFAKQLNEKWLWHSPDQLIVDEQLNLCVVGTAGQEKIAYGLCPTTISEPDPQVMTHCDGSDWPIMSLSETIVRECVLQLIGTSATSRLHTEMKQKTHEHPLGIKADSALSQIPTAPERHGLVELFEGQNVLLARRFPPRSTKVDFYLMGRKASDIKQFLKSDATKAAPKRKDMPRKQPATPHTTVAKLRKNFKEYLQTDYAPAAEFIVDAAVPCIRFVDLGQTKRAKVGATRFGGDPDLPSDFQWPTDPDAPPKNNALLFLGQFNFKELPSWKGSPFPKSGLLSIFIGTDGFQGSACGFYFSSRKQLKRAKTPTDRLVNDYKNQSLSPIRVSAELSLSIPAYVSEFQQQIAKFLQDQEGFDADYLNGDLQWLEQILFGKESLGQMGGYAVTPIGTDYHERAACKQLGVNGFVGRRNSFNVSAIKNKRTRQKVYTQALLNQVLLSMDSGNATVAMWSDCGILYLLHDQERIAQRDFGSFPSFIYH